MVGQGHSYNEGLILMLRKYSPAVLELLMMLGYLLKPNCASQIYSDGQWKTFVGLDRLPPGLIGSQDLIPEL